MKKKITFVAIDIESLTQSDVDKLPMYVLCLNEELNEEYYGSVEECSDTGKWICLDYEGTYEYPITHVLVREK